MQSFTPYKGTISKTYRKRSKHLSVNDKAPKNKDFDFKRIFAVTDWTVRIKIKYDI